MPEGAIWGPIKCSVEGCNGTAWSNREVFKVLEQVDERGVTRTRRCVACGGKVTLGKSCRDCRREHDLRCAYCRRFMTEQGMLIYPQEGLERICVRCTRMYENMTPEEQEKTRSLFWTDPAAG